MKISTHIDLVANRYRVTVEVHSPTAHEAETLAQYGEPLVETGGTVTGSATRPGEGATSVTLSLPAEQRRLLADFPLVRVFDLGDDADADVQARVYADTIASRVASARNALMSNSSHFIGETTTTLTDA